MAHVTMQRPIAGYRDELDIARLSDGDDFSHFTAPLLSRPPSAVRAGHEVLHSMQVDGVVPHREIANSNADALAGACDDGFDRREDFAIEGPQIEVLHDRW